MKAAVLRSAKDIRVENVSLPKIEETSALIRVSYCGICGSDYPRYLYGNQSNRPIVMGHELSGKVVQVGKKVTKFVLDDRVIGIPLLPCHECEECKTSNYSTCKNYSYIGSRIPGGMAEYIVLPEENILLLPERVSLLEGVFIEPLTIAINAARHIASIPKNSRIAIIGGGVIGLLIYRILSYSGYTGITVCGRREAGLSMAHKIGVSNLADTSKETLVEIKDRLTESMGFDAIFETSGNVNAFQQALQLSKNRAQIVLVGLFGNRIELEPAISKMIVRKELILQGSWMSYSSPFPGSTWHEAMSLIEQNEIFAVEDFIHSIFHLEKTEAAFNQFASGLSICGRVIINCNP